MDSGSRGDVQEKQVGRRGGRPSPLRAPITPPRTRPACAPSLQGRILALQLRSIEVRLAYLVVQFSHTTPCVGMCCEPSYAVYDSGLRDLVESVSHCARIGQIGNRHRHGPAVKELQPLSLH